MSDDFCSPRQPAVASAAATMTDSPREIRWLTASIVILVLLRLWMMATHPLTDTTEARYGELARVTADGGFWLMPHMTPTEPFFAKPPLSTWLAAGSWKLLGQTEFSLRFPSFVMSIITVGLTLVMARDVGVGCGGRWMTATMLVTSPMFLASAGAVMTDATQMSIVTAAMLVSWRALRDPERRRWRLLFWSLLGIATLAKGLATLALIGLPLIAYIAFGEGLVVVWRRLFDPWGPLLAAALCLAWYVPAERAYPGFLNYFLIGEHFQRFLQPGWAGDRYGRAHRTPLGMIWLYWIAGIGLWLPVFFGEAQRLVRRLRREPVAMSDRWLWCWVLAPLIFFTASRNIIVTYTLTAIPPFAMIVGQWSESNPGRLRRIAPACAMGFALVLGAVGLSWLPRAIEDLSARQLVTSAKTLAPEATIVVRGCYPFSSSFYTRGCALRIDDKVAFAEAIQQPGIVLLVSEKEALTLRANPHLRELARNSRGTLLEVLRETAPDR